MHEELAALITVYLVDFLYISINDIEFHRQTKTSSILQYCGSVLILNTNADHCEGVGLADVHFSPLRIYLKESDMRRKPFSLSKAKQSV